MSDTVIRVENISKLYRLGEVGTGSLAHDVNRWWHKVRGKEDPYLKIGEVNDRTKPAKQASADGTTNHTNKREKLTTEDTESTERGAGGNQRADSGEFLEGHSQAGLQMDSEKLASIRSANDSRASGDRSTLDSGLSTPSSSKALDSRPSTLVSPKAAPSDWVYALKDVSFEVKRGEVLGIIGRNGAGKSTLLKILSRVTTQSSGQIKVKGRIASLLEVGTGFHPELTGRENIFLNGAILGMRKAEIARKFDEIVEFSGCARYIDTPVKRYSSGMYVRLAFAVAAHLEPEILIVDEVLAVGDAEFQKKCLGKMKDVAGHGRTILFVSHNMSAVMNLCTRCLYTKNGMIAADGETAGVVDCYLRDNAVRKSEVSFTSLDMNACSKQVSVLGARVLNSKGDIGGTILTTEPTFIEVDYVQLKNEAAPKLNIHLSTEDNTCAFACFEITNGVKKRGKIRSRVEIPAEFLNSRSYTVSIYFTNVTNNKPVIELKDILVLEVVDNMDAPSRQDYKGYFPGVVRPVMPWTTSQIC